MKLPIHPEIHSFDYFFDMVSVDNRMVKMEKWGISKNSNIENRGILKNKHVTSLKMKNEPKMKVFDFGAFQKNMHLASREKYIFHMLFGAFHITPGIIFVLAIISLKLVK